MRKGFRKCIGRDTGVLEDETKIFNFKVKFASRFSFIFDEHSVLFADFPTILTQRIAAAGADFAGDGFRGRAGRKHEAITRQAHY